VNVAGVGGLGHTPYQTKKAKQPIERNPNGRHHIDR
jgi:hypothetical protein